MLPSSFEDILHGPAFVINLDRCQERWPIMKSRVEAAGFMPERITAIDGLDGNCRALWKDFMDGRPYEYLFDSDGQSACSLSHVYLWQMMVEKSIPFASVFEDDVMFHKDWQTLAPTYYEQTDHTRDIIYYGSQGAGTPNEPMITRKSVFCTHAYIITQDGARRMLEHIRNKNRLFTIDCMIIHEMDRPSCCFTWQCWNATMYPDPARETTLRPRNDGLVYQDADFVSNIHCHAPRAE